MNEVRRVLINYFPKEKKFFEDKFMNIIYNEYPKNAIWKIEGKKNIIIYTLSYCIQKIENLKNAVKPSDTIIYYLNLWQDSYIPMCIWIENSLNTNINIDEKEFKQFFPNLNFIFSTTELPKYLSLIINCHFWSKLPKKMKRSDDREEQFKEGIVHLFGKIINHKYQIRDIEKPLIFLCNLCDIFYKSILKILFCSLLGTYTHAKIRPSFKTRKALYINFVYKKLNKDIFINWICNEYIYLVIHVLREFLIYSVYQLTALRNVLCISQYWKDLEINTVNVMDQFRLYLTNRENTPEIWFNEESKYGIEWFYKENREYTLIFGFRCNEMNFLNYMYTQIRDLDLRRRYNDKNYIIDLPEMELNYMKKMLTKFNSWDPLSYEWVVILFKLDFKNIVELQIIEDKYQNNGSKTIVIETIKNWTPIEYSVFRYFFNELYLMKNIQIYSLPHCLYIEQVKKLMEIYNTNEIKDKWITYYVCFECKQFKSILMEKSLLKKSKANKRKLFSVGHIEIMNDFETNKFYCYNKKKDKKDENDDSYDYFDNINFEEDYKDIKEKNKKMRKKAKHERETNLKTICMNSEVVPINLLGVLFVFFDK